MRRLTIFVLIATILVMGFSAVRPVAASGGGTTANGILVKNHGVSTTFNRHWVWDIAKTGSAADLLLSPGETGSVDYTVAVTGVPQDSDWAMAGQVTFRNMGATDIIVTSVVVDITGGIQLVPSCATPPGYPPIIHPGYSVECFYATTLPDNSPRTSVATVTTTDTSVSDSEAITFGSMFVEFGQTINVVDSFPGILGQVTGGANPTTAAFNYTRTVGPYDVCGDYLVTNTASIVETGQSSSWDVSVKVPCAGGCTLTLGYWKTHSQLGPAPYDADWQNLGPQQEQTSFYLSGKSWYTVFWTAPRGNVYYILAHQYMAAKLNMLDGAASTPAVSTAITFAENFFSTYTPSSTFSSTLKSQANANAATLDQYNNGLIGPGHCSD